MRRLCLFLGATILVGCSDAVAPRLGLVVETDKPQYSLSSDVSVIVTLRNPSNAPAYLSGVIERNAAWRISDKSFEAVQAEAGNVSLSIQRLRRP
jgi:uncharacterized protein YcfL